MSEDDPQKDREDAPEELTDAPGQHGEGSRDVAEEQNIPLTPNEFRVALRRVDALGLTWTADLLPEVKPKGSEGREALLSEEYREIRQQYPRLPRELSVLVIHILTGQPPFIPVAASKEDLEDKAAAVREIVLTGEFRSEFFFKHAIKVPYFSGVDWEVVLKAFEKNVRGVPAIPYALLSLRFYGPRRSSEGEEETKTMTVAVDQHLVDSIISSLIEVKTALKQTQGIADRVNQWSTEEDEYHD
jgi:hypothetical protein